LNFDRSGGDIDTLEKEVDTHTIPKEREKKKKKKIQFVDIQKIFFVVLIKQFFS
jgi:hypothetical protein